MQTRGHLVSISSACSRLCTPLQCRRRRQRVASPAGVETRADLPSPPWLPPCALSSVFVRVSSTIVKPRQDRPYEGLISLNFELSPMASTSYETGR